MHHIERNQLRHSHIPREVAGNTELVFVEPPERKDGFADGNLVRKDTGIGIEEILADLDALERISTPEIPDIAYAIRKRVGDLWVTIYFDKDEGPKSLCFHDQNGNHVEHRAAFRLIDCGEQPRIEQLSSPMVEELNKALAEKTLTIEIASTHQGLLVINGQFELPSDMREMLDGDDSVFNASLMEAALGQIIKDSPYAEETRRKLQESELKKAKEAETRRGYYSFITSMDDEVSQFIHLNGEIVLLRMVHTEESGPQVGLRKGLSGTVQIADANFSSEDGRQTVSCKFRPYYDYYIVESSKTENGVLKFTHQDAFNAYLKLAGGIRLLR